MLETIDTPEQEEITDINSKNVFFKIWVHPKRAFHYIINYQPEKYVYLFFALGALANAIDRMERHPEDLTDNSISYYFGLALGSMVIGLLIYMAFSWAMSVTGMLLNGSSPAWKFRSVLAWSFFPACINLFFILIKFIVLGHEVFTYEFTFQWTQKESIVIFLTLLQAASFIWGLIILIAGVSYIQNFSIVKAIFNILLTIIIIIAIVLIFVFVIFK